MINTYSKEIYKILNIKVIIIKKYNNNLIYGKNNPVKYHLKAHNASIHLI